MRGTSAIALLLGVCSVLGNRELSGDVGTTRRALFGVRTSRGGAQTKKKDVDQQHAFVQLARAVQGLDSDPTTSPEVEDLVKAFKTLSQAQKTFKGLDGMAHEAYQRTHKSDQLKGNVAGRAARTASRTSAVASALGACELCELVLQPEVCLGANASITGTLAGREVVVNETIALTLEEDPALDLRVLAIYEPLYRGGSGVNYGNLQDIIETNTTTTKVAGPRRIVGRLLVACAVQPHGALTESLESCMRILSKPPSHVRLYQGQETEEAASVQPSLHAASSLLLERLDPVLRQYNQSAIHFMGHSLGGGVACLAAAMLEGRLPLKASTKKRRRTTKTTMTTGKKKDEMAEDEAATTAATNQSAAVVPQPPPLRGLGRSRTSAVALGAPPSMSSNVETDFIVSILHGDDWMGRATSDSLERFFARTKKALKKGFLGSQLNRMGDTLALATSNLKQYAHGSEGEEARLSVPGRAFLIRPRRLGGVCSIHEMGRQLKGGREAIRASMLWQLNDVLLSGSLLKHHQLEAYIQGLDRVQLRATVSGNDEHDDEEEEDDDDEGT